MEEFGLTGDGWACASGGGAMLVAGDAERTVFGLDGGTGPVYTCPSSPGEKDRKEQNPSDELIIKVNPSFDLL